MIHINNKENCCGCTACEMICPKDAIIMQNDHLGFLYPKVDMEKCIDCGLCEKVCSFHKSYDKSSNLNEPDVYAVRHKDMKEIESSRSGAMFIAISDYILDKGGVVYGAGYTDHFRVVHKRADDKEGRNEFKGSKYVQSDMNRVFKQVKDDLKNNLIVLFSGTPCQTSGLKSFLKLSKIEITNLFVCDIVCHGVPSPFIWRDYLTFFEKKAKQEAKAVDFRDKCKFGWSAHKESLTFNQKKIYNYSYTYVFYKHIMFRHSCGVCHFTNFQRPSDVTLADFWGYEKTIPEFNHDDKGVSLVLLNSEKGQNLFAEIKASINYIKSNTKDCIQPNLVHPSDIHPQRNNFEKDYVDKGLMYVMKKYGNMDSISQLKYKYRGLKKNLKKMISM